VRDTFQRIPGCSVPPPVPASGWDSVGLEGVREYYRSSAVRHRIAEYCGGLAGDAQSFTALVLAGYGGADHLRTREGAPVSLSLSAFARLLHDGADVCRSLGDRTGTLLVFDIDYMNPDDPFEPYRDPARTFEALEPVLSCVRDILTGYGVRALTLMTGRGYHLVMKVPVESPFEEHLIRLGTPDHRDEFRKPREDPSRRTDVVHAGAGRLMQFLAHETLRATADATSVPVRLIDMPNRARGPFVCLDLSAYGDPVQARTVRCAYSANQKARGVPGVPSAGIVAVLPRNREPVDTLLLARSSPRSAAAWAADHSCAIPEVDRADAWLAAYETSRLARFHRYFDTETHESEWSDGACESGRTWPACALFPLNQPNDPLLTPGWIRTVALTLWAGGFHPARIVRLIASRYAERHGWGDYWDRYDREMRARFYVRAACGALADELEDWSAFTCDTQRTQGFCTGGGCGVDLSRIGPPRGKGMP
jgi:hypothetical protein